MVVFLENKVSSPGSRSWHIISPTKGNPFPAQGCRSVHPEIPFHSNNNKNQPSMISLQSTLGWIAGQGRSSTEASPQSRWVAPARFDDRALRFLRSKFQPRDGFRLPLGRPPVYCWTSTHMTKDGRKKSTLSKDGPRRVTNAQRRPPSLSGTVVPFQLAAGRFHQMRKSGLTVL